MSEPTNKPSACKGDCPGCASGNHMDEHRMPDEQVDGGLEGGRLVIAAAGAFLLPLALAIVGAFVASGSTERSLVGAVVGLGVGVAIAAIVARLWARRRSAGPEEQEQA